MKKYTLEVTEEQLLSIARACESVSRMMSGQLMEVKTLMEFTNDITKGDFTHDDVEKLINQLKSLINLDPGESLGIRESSLEARRLYEIYFLIKHFFAKDAGGINVYKHNLLEVTDEPKIIINKQP